MNDLIQITNASLRLGNKTLWSKLNLTVKPGEFIAILGPNGAGKSSLLNILLGLIPANSGDIKVLCTSPKKARQKIGYVPQQKSFDTDITATGRDFVSLGADGTKWFWRPRPSDTIAKVQQVLSEVGATRYADRPLGKMSGGEQQRIRIGQAIASDPQLLFCDEPLLALDLASQASISKLINDQRQKGTAVLFVTHEVNPILPMVDRILYIVDGKWAIGTPNEILTREKLSQLYGTHIDVVRVHNNIIITGAVEHSGAEPRDTHHHNHEETS